jgi:hypothetical protein
LAEGSTTAHEVRLRAICNNCCVKGNNKYQIVCKGNSGMALDGAGVRQVKLFWLALNRRGGAKNSCSLTVICPALAFFVKKGRLAVNNSSDEAKWLVYADVVGVDI